MVLPAPGVPAWLVNKHKRCALDAGAAVPLRGELLVLTACRCFCSRLAQAACVS